MNPKLSSQYNTPTSQHSDLKGIRGSILTFNKDPFLNDEDSCYTYFEDGLIVVDNGKIIDVGPYDLILTKFNTKLGQNNIDVYKDSLILPGFVDTHLHYVQTPMIGSYGDTLLKWLNQYTFPTESRFKNKEFADDVARQFFRQLLSQGTTTANVFATTFEESVDAFFEESERYNTRMISGKVLQDRNIPDSLRDKSAEESVELSERLLNKWHNRGRQLYAVIPRFAPTSTPKQLALSGELYQKYIDRGVYMHTHLDEAHNEIEWVKDLFPESANYTDVYKRFGLVDHHSVMAHCCLVLEEEWRTLFDGGCGVAHCPSSNLFLGDGEFKFWEAKNPERPLNVGVATDVGGGTNFSVFRQLGEAYKVGMIQGKSLSAQRCLYLATRGGAETLRLDDRIGSIAPGYEADLAILDMKPSEFAEWRLSFSDNLFDKIFVLMTLGLNDMIKATYVAGNKVYDRNREFKWSYVGNGMNP